MHINSYSNNMILHTNAVEKQSTAKFDVPTENINNTSTNPFRVLPQGYAPINFKSNDGLKPAPKELKPKMAKAEAVMTHVKNMFPSISPSRVMYLFNQKNVSPEHKEWLKEKQHSLEDARYEYSGYDDVEEASNLLNSVKKNKVANCYELTKMTEVALRANGVRNVERVSLVGYSNPEWQQQYGLDHTLLIVNPDFNESENWDKPTERYGKSAFVVDPWLDFVDTVDNALKIYDKTWKKIPHSKEINGYGFEESFSYEFEPSDIRKIKAKHPELVLPENVNYKRFDS